jgi:hypothetical protein
MRINSEFVWKEVNENIVRFVKQHELTIRTWRRTVTVLIGVPAIVITNSVAELRQIGRVDDQNGAVLSHLHCDLPKISTL